MIYTRWTNTTCRDCGKAMRVPAGTWGEPTTRDCGCGDGYTYKEDNREEEPNVTGATVIKAARAA